MRKFIFLAVIAISLFVGHPCFSQTQEEPELNSVPLSDDESHIYLDSLNSVWVRMRNILKNKEPENFWTYGGIIITNPKVVGDKKYTLTIDKASHSDNGNIVSTITFEVKDNNPVTEFYPLEVITFFYNHTDRQGMAMLSISYFKGDSDFHKKTPGEIQEKLKELIRQINDLI